VPAKVSKRVRYSWRALRTGFAFVVFGAGAIIFVSIVLPLSLLPLRAAAKRERRTQWFVHQAFRLFAWFMERVGLIRVSRIGMERLADTSPNLIVANHPTLIDVVLLLASLPQADCIVKNAARRNIFLRGIVNHAGYLPNDQSDALVVSCVERLRDNRSLLLFPEGTRSPKGGLGPFKRGSAHIALKGRRPIVPIVITCNPPTLLKGERWYDVPDGPAHFTLRAEKPIDPTRYLEGETTPPVAARRLTADLRAFYQTRLCGEVNA
jgi:1-acyl-sn-glycerol-3-phosphate acyltransferase